MIASTSTRNQRLIRDPYALIRRLCDGEDFQQVFRLIDLDAFTVHWHSIFNGAAETADCLGKQTEAMSIRDLLGLLEMFQDGELA